MSYNIVFVSGCCQVKGIPAVAEEEARTIARTNLGKWCPVPWDASLACKVNRIFVENEDGAIVERYETLAEPLCSARDVNQTTNAHLGEIVTSLWMTKERQ